jgi:hypothetical protein
MGMNAIGDLPASPLVTAEPIANRYLRLPESIRNVGLRASMSVWGAVSVTFGLVSMLFPGVIGAIGDASTNTFLLGSWGWLTAVLGLGILFASRNPIRHVLWLKITIFSFVIGGLYDVAHVMAGTVTFGAITLDMAAYFIFGALFMGFYPRGPWMVSLELRTPQGTLHTDADSGGLFVRENGTGAFVAYAPPRQNPPIGPSYLPRPSRFTPPMMRNEDPLGRLHPPPYQPPWAEPGSSRFSTPNPAISDDGGEIILGPPPSSAPNESAAPIEEPSSGIQSRNYEELLRRFSQPPVDDSEIGETPKESTE